MKSKKLGIITLFLLSPLVMANAPAPQVSNSPYDDFTMTFISKTSNPDGSEGVFEFHYNVTNTGAGYLKEIRAEKDSRNEAYLTIEDEHFGDIVLGPNQTKEVKIYTTIDFETTEGISFTGSGFSEFLENPFKDNDFTIEIDQQYTTSTYYVIKANFNFDVDESGYRFGAIIDATYKGEDISIFNRDLYSDGKIEFGYYSETPLDLEQFTINNIKIVKTEYHSPYSFIGDAFGVMRIIAIVFVAVFMGGGFLFLCIFFPIREVKKRKRMKEQKNG